MIQYQMILVVIEPPDPSPGFDVPCIKFKRLLVGAKTIEKVHITNKALGGGARATGGFFLVGLCHKQGCQVLNKIIMI